MLKRLNKRYAPVSGLKVHVCLDGNVYLDRIAQKSEQWTHSVFISIPLRLGLNFILPEYLVSVKKAFTLPQTVGIAGGRENSALYFVGVSEPSNNLIYLDPHLVQKSVSSAHALDSDFLWRHVPSYHCAKIKKLPLEKMCTSVALGFYVRNEADFESFTASIKDMA